MNSAKDAVAQGVLQRPWVEKFPFQPEWAPWHPSYSLDAAMQGPPRYRQFVKMTDAAFVRLYLQYARQIEMDRRVAKRDMEEKIFDHNFFEKKANDAWMERHDLWIEKYWELVQQNRVFLALRLKQGEAVRAYRRVLESITLHEKRLDDLYADMVAARKFATQEFGLQQLFTTTENGVVVQLPKYGRAVQVLFGNIFKEDVHQRLAQNFHWHAAHRYMITDNGVIVPLPIMGKPVHVARAHITEVQNDKMRVRELQGLLEKSIESKKDYQKSSDIVSLKNRRDLIKSTNEVAVKNNATMRLIAQPAAEKKVVELQRVDQQEVAQNLRQEARSRLTKFQLLEDPQARYKQDEIKLLERPADKILGKTLDEKIQSHDPADEGELRSKEQQWPLNHEKPVAFDRPIRRLDELDRVITIDLDLQKVRKEKTIIKDLQRNLAAQGAAAESLLARHVGQASATYRAERTDVEPQSDGVPNLTKKS